MTHQESQRAPEGGVSDAPEFLPADDIVRLRRLLDRTLGVGFKLAVIEVPDFSQRSVVRDWLRRLFAERQATEQGIDLVQLLGARDEWRGGSANTWGELTRTIVPGSLSGQRAALVVWGFEELQDCSADADWDLVRQFNIQRDLFVRDYACFWVLLIDPASRHHWLNTAPDFCDFVALWIAVPERPIPVRPEFAAKRIEKLSNIELPARQHWPRLLRQAWDELRKDRLDAALDRIHSFRFALPIAAEATHDLAIADLLESGVLEARGATATALHHALDLALPVLQADAAREPGRDDYQHDLVTSLVWAAQVEPARAVSHLERAYEVLTTLHAAQRLDAETAGWIPHLAALLSAARGEDRDRRGGMPFTASRRI